MSKSHKSSGQKSSGHAGKTKDTGAAKHQYPELVFDQDGYDITLHGAGIMPQEFRNMIVRRAYVELLRLASDNSPVVVQNAAKNHAIIKIDFATKYNQYEGARISMQPNYEIGSSGPNGGPMYKAGQLMLKPVTYAEASRSAARNCLIDVQPNVSLDWLLSVLTSKKLHNFCFIDIEEKYYGCRDFITQAVYQLYVANYTRGRILKTKPVSPGLAHGVTNAFAALGYRYLAHPLGLPQVCLIDKGWFPEYERVELGFMPYH